METLAIVFAILTVAFVLDMGNLNRLALGGIDAAPSRFDVSTILTVTSLVAAVVFGVLGAF